MVGFKSVNNLLRQKEVIHVDATAEKEYEKQKERDMVVSQA